MHSPGGGCVTNSVESQTASTLHTERVISETSASMLENQGLNIPSLQGARNWLR